MNGDGKLDLILACSSSVSANDMRLLLGNGDGTFAPARDYVGDHRQIPWADDKRGRPGLLVSGQRGATLLRDASR